VSAPEPLVPHEWQNEDISSLLFFDLNAVVAVDTGGGKSLIATEAVIRSGYHTQGSVLIIAPKPTFTKTWQKTFERQAGITPRRINSSKAGKEAEADLRANKPGVYLINHELFTRRDWKGVTPEVAVVDEAHKTASYRLARKANSGAHKLIHFKAKRRMVMSATPYRNDFANMWTLLRWVYPDTTPASARRWIAEYCLTKDDYFAGEVVIGEKEPGRVVSEIPCYIYHAKRSHCCDWHPNGFLATDAPEEIVRTVELTPAMKRAYKQLEKDYVTWLGENPLVVEIPIVMRARLRQLSLGMVTFDDEGQVTYAPDCESPKYDELKRILTEEIPDEPVLVVTHSRKFAQVVAARLTREGIPAESWDGSKSQKHRDEMGDRFASGEIRVLVGVIAAMGTGVDFLQEVTSTMVWLSRSDDATDSEQAKGRLDRMGAIGRMVSIEIQAEGTYDENILDKNIEAALARNASLSSK